MRFAPGFLLASFVLAANCLFEWPYALRFSSPAINYIFGGLIAAALPLSLLFYALNISKRWLRVSLITCGAVGLVVSFLLVSFFAIVDGAFSTSRNASLDLQDTIKVENVNYRLYVDQGGGAFSPPFTLLRKELELPFGAKLVKTIKGYPQYGNSKLQRISDSEIELIVDEGFYRDRIKIK
jgi:hypothetical protein